MLRTHADAAKWKLCSAKALHALLWVALAPGRGPFSPLSKEEADLPFTELTLLWASRIRAAASSFRVAVMSAANGDFLKPGAPVATVAREGPAARELGSLAALNNEREGAAGAVMCAMAFEVLGQATGVLAHGGWQRAHGMFALCMVRSPPLLHTGKTGLYIATLPIATLPIATATVELACQIAHGDVAASSLTRLVHHLAHTRSQHA